jgi:hypothetical protein
MVPVGGPSRELVDQPEDLLPQEHPIGSAPRIGSQPAQVVDESSRQQQLVP